MENGRKMIRHLLKMNPFTKSPMTVNFDTWSSFSAKSDYLQGYFDFPSFQKSGDTASKRIRSFALLSSLNSIIESDLNGMVAECGCYMGHSTYGIATILKKANFNNKFYVFDSFEGLSDPQKPDLQSMAGFTEPSRLRKLFLNKHLEFKGDFEKFKEIMSSFPFVDVKKGWIPERFDEVANENFIFVHIDVDIYQPTKDSLRFFAPRLLPGGLIFFDDYARPYWPGCKKAVDEFLLEVDPCCYRLIEIPLGGATLVKIK